MNILGFQVIRKYKNENIEKQYILHVVKEFSEYLFMGGARL
jgi:hypothetical protein